MIRSRRDFIKVGAVASAYAALSAPGFGLAAEPALGLIFPPLNYPIPDDAKRLYPAGVRSLGNGVGLPGGMTVEGYEEAIRSVLRAADARGKERAKEISVFCTSFTCNRSGSRNAGS